MVFQRTLTTSDWDHKIVQKHPINGVRSGVISNYIFCIKREPSLYWTLDMALEVCLHFNLKSNLKPWSIWQLCLFPNKLQVVAEGLCGRLKFSSVQFYSYNIKSQWQSPQGALYL